MLPDYYLNALGYDPLDIFRHELAHCNGWPANHPDTPMFQPSNVDRNADAVTTVPASAKDMLFAVIREKDGKPQQAYQSC